MQFAKGDDMGIDGLMSDKVILEELGRRLGRRRVELEFTQAELAKEAGVSKRTVERVEAGDSTQTSTLIRILRILGLLEALDAALPETGPRPMDLLKLRGKERRRASSKKRGEDAEEEWSWGDET
jgi:transcriptional regulator with XRE-family HTH domain